MEIIRSSDITPKKDTVKYDITKESGAPIYYNVNKKLQEDLYNFGVNNIMPTANLYEEAALLQPFSNKLWRSGKVFGAIAGSTFLDTFVGTVAGIANLAKGGKDGEIEFNDFVDNPFSSSLDEWLEEVRTNNILYDTEADKNKPFYEKLSTANFWLHQFENAGFLVGALGATVLTGNILGALLSLNKLGKYSKVVNALAKIEGQGSTTLKTTAKRMLTAMEANPMRVEQIADDIIQMAGKIKTRTAINQIGSSILGKMGEARIEALSNGREWEQEQLENLKYRYGENIPEFELKRLEEEKKYLQNTIFGINVAALSLFDYVQFKNLLTGGVKLNSKVLTDIITKSTTKEGLSFATKQMSKAEKIAKYIISGGKNPFAEMTQEQLQFATAEGTKDYFDLRTDREALENTKTIIGSIFKGLEEAYGSAEGWENAFGGFIFGGLGLPYIKRNDKGNLRIGIGGGIANGIREYNESLKATNAAIAKANEYATNDKFRSLFDYMVSDAAIQKSKNEAYAKGFEAVARTQEKVQLANMVAAFSDIGQLDVLKEKINDLNSILEGSSSAETINKYKEELEFIEKSIQILESLDFSDLPENVENLDESPRNLSNIKKDGVIANLINRYNEIKNKLSLGEELQKEPKIGIEKAASELRKMLSYTVTENINGKETEVTKSPFDDLSDEALVSKMRNRLKKISERIDKFEELYQSINYRFSNYSEDTRKSLFLNVVQTEDVLERGNKLLRELQQIATKGKTSSRYNFRKEIKAKAEYENLLKRVLDKLSNNEFIDEELQKEGNDLLDLISFTKGKRYTNLEDLRDALKESIDKYGDLLLEKQSEFEQERDWRSAVDLQDFSRVMLDKDSRNAFLEDLALIEKDKENGKKEAEKGLDLLTLSDFRTKLVEAYYKMVTNEELEEYRREKKALSLLEKKKEKDAEKKAVNSEVAQLYKNLNTYVDGDDVLEKTYFPEVEALTKEAKELKTPIVKRASSELSSKFLSGAIVLSTDKGPVKRLFYKEGDPNTLYEQVKDSKGNWIFVELTYRKKDGTTFKRIKTKSAANFVKQVRENLEKTGVAFYEESFYSKKDREEYKKRLEEGNYTTSPEELEEAEETQETEKTTDKNKSEKITVRYTISYVNSEYLQRQDEINRINRQYQARIISLESLIAEQQDAVNNLKEINLSTINENIDTLQKEFEEVNKEYTERTSSNRFNSKQAKDKTYRLLQRGLEILRQLENLKSIKQERLNLIQQENSNVYEALQVLNKELEEVKASYNEFKKAAPTGKNVDNPEYLKKIKDKIKLYEETLNKFDKVKEDLSKYEEDIKTIIDKLNIELESINSQTTDLKKGFNSLLSDIIKRIPEGLLPEKTIDGLHAYFTSNKILDKDLEKDIEALFELSYDYFGKINFLEGRKVAILEEKSKLGYYNSLLKKLSSLSSFKVQADSLKKEYKNLVEEKAKTEKEVQKKFSVANKGVIETLDNELDEDLENDSYLYQATYVDLYGWAVSTGRDSERGDYGKPGESSNPVIEERRFFRWLENIGINEDPKNYKFMSVTINDEVYGLGKPNSVYNDPKIEGVNHNEDDIRLVLVDSENKPVIAYGGVVYAKLRDLSLNFKDTNSPRYSFFNKDLSKETKAEILSNALEVHKQIRDIIKKNSNKNFFFNITSFNPGKPISNKTKNSVVGTIVEKESDIADKLNILVSIGEKSEKGKTNRTITAGERRIVYPAGRVLFKLGNTWIPAITRKINRQEAETVYQLVKAYLQNYRSTLPNTASEKAKEAKTTESLNLSYKNLITYIENIVYLSENSVIPFDIKEDVLVLQNKVITLDTLEENKDEIIETLQKKVLNVNNRILALLNNKNKEENLPKYKSVLWNGYSFEETEWDSYKHYLTSPLMPNGTTRQIEDIPLTTFLRIKQDATEDDIINDKVRRFQQGYATFEPNPLSPDSTLSGESKETINNTIPQTEDNKSKVTKITAIREDNNFNVIVDVKNRKFKIETKERIPEVDEFENKINLDFGGNNMETKSVEQIIKEIEDNILPILGKPKYSFKITKEFEQNLEKKAQESNIKNEASLEGFFGEAPKVDLNDPNINPEAKPKTNSNNFSDIDKAIDDAINSAFRIYTGILDTINIEEAENWLVETLGIDITDRESYERVDNLIEGIASGRILSNGKILLSTMGEQGTEYHEAFHYVSNLLISKEEQKELWDEWRLINNKPDATDKEAEEGLAEGFAIYMLNKKAKSKKQESLFRKILNLIKAAFSLNTNKKIEDFYARIERGEFKNAKKVRENLMFSKLDSVRNINNAAVAKRIHNKVISKLLANDIKILYLFNSDDFKEIIRPIYNASFKEMLEEDGLTQKFEELPYERKKEILQQAVVIHKDFIKALGYTQPSEEDIEEDDISEEESDLSLGKDEVISKEVSNESYKEAYLINQKSKIKTPLRLVLASFADTYEYDKFINKLMNKLANSISYEEIKGRLLNSKDTGFRKLYNLLNLLEDRAKNGDYYSAQFIVSFYNSFSKHKENFENLIVNRDGTVNRVNTNTTKTQDITLRKWLNNLLTINNDLVYRENGTIRLTKKGKEYLASTTTQQLDFLEKLGIKFENKEAVKNYLNSENGIEDLKSITLLINDLKSEKITLDKLGSKDFYTNTSLSRLKRLVELESSFNEDVVENVAVTSKGEMIYSITLHNYISRLVYKLSSGIIPNFLNKNTNIYARDSIILERISKKKNAIRVGITNGMSKAAETGQDVSQLSFKDFLIVELNNILSKNFSFLITGDKKSFRTFSLDNFFINISGYSKFDMVKQTVDQLYKYYLTELEIIKQKKNKDKIIVNGEQFLNDLVIFKNIRDKNGNTINIIDSEEVVKNKIKDYVEFQITSNYNLFKNNGIIKSNKINVSKEILREVLNIKEGKEKELTEEQIEKVVTAFTTNYIISAIEQTKVLFGNPAYYITKYKGNIPDLTASFIDMFKRYAGAVATTKQVINTPVINEYMDTYMPRVDGKTGEDRLKVKVVTFEDIVSVKEELSILGVKGYDEIDETDSFGIILDDLYRDLLFRSDSWSEEMNKAWELESKGEEANSILPSIKPVIYGNSSEEELKPFYVKFALLRLSPTLIKAIKEDSEAFPALYSLLEKMRNNQIDIGVFRSGNKIGFKLKKGEKGKYQGQPLYNESGEIADIDNELVTEIPIESIGIQVENSPKDAKETSRGTQEAAIIATDLADKGTFKKGTITIKNKVLTIEEAVRDLFKAQSDLTDYYLDKVKQELNLKYENGRAVFSDGGEALKKLLIEEINSRGEIPDNQIEALILELEGLEKGKPVYLDLLVNYNKLEPILYSIFENKAVNQKRFGKSLVQFPDTGTELKVRERINGKYKSNGLKFYENGKTMEIYLPYYFGNILSEGQTINKIDPNNLKMYGFRIPTEQLNSLESIVVKGFLPKSYGNTCIVPSGITKKVGSDFDFDKINIYFPNFIRKKVDKIDLEDFENSYEYFNYTDEDDRIAIKNLLKSSNYTFTELLQALNSYSLKSDKGELGKLKESKAYKSYSEDTKTAISNLKLALINFNRRKNEENKNLKKYEYIYVEPNEENLNNPELREKALQNKILEYTIALLESRSPKDKLEPNSISKYKDLSLVIEKKLQEFYPDRVINNYSFTDLLNFKTISTLRNMFWYGKGLVGIFALANKSHPLFQIADIRINSNLKLDDEVLNFSINFKGIEKDSNGYYSLGNIYTVDENGNPTNEKISNVLGQGVSLAVDVVKNPEVMERFNLNAETADVFLFLVSAGLPSQTALYFISQPIIREYVEIISRHKSISTMISTKEDELEQLKTKYGDYKYNKLTLEQLQQFNRQVQQNILEDFLTYKKVAFKISQMRSAFSFDTRGLGSTDAVKDLLKTNREILTSGNFKNLDRYLQFTFLDSFKKVYNASLFTFKDLIFTEQFDEVVYSLDSFREELLERVFKSKNRNKVSKLLKNDFKISILTSGEKFANWQSLFKGDESLPKRLKKYQEEVKDSRLDYLIPMINPDGDGIDNIRLSNRNFNAYVMQEIASAIEDMFNRGGKDLSLATDLIKFSMLQSGYNFTQFSINQILPAVISRKVVKTILDKIDINAHINTFNIFRRNFYINNWRNSDIVPYVSYSKASKLILRVNDYKAAPFIKTTDNNDIYRLYERIGLDGSGRFYIYQEIPLPVIANIKGKIWTTDINNLNSGSINSTNTINEVGNNQNLLSEPNRQRQTASEIYSNKQFTNLPIKKSNPININAKFPKDQIKADYADGIIAYGEPGTSTYKYANAFGGTRTSFKAGETIMISVNGKGRPNQAENLEKTKKAIDLALSQGVKFFIADNENDANSNHNSVGEGAIRKYLLDKGLEYQPFNGVGLYINKSNNQTFNQISNNNYYPLDLNLVKELQEKIQSLYPELGLNITNNPTWETDKNVFNQTIPDEINKFELFENQDTLCPNGICNFTAKESTEYLKKIGLNPYPSSPNGDQLSVFVKSPLGNFDITHYVSAVAINNAIYIYDMPQHEFISNEFFGLGSHVKVKETYKPRLIPLTLDDIQANYNLSPKEAGRFIYRILEAQGWAGADATPPFREYIEQNISNPKEYINLLENEIKNSEYEEKNYIEEYIKEIENRKKEVKEKPLSSKEEKQVIKYYENKLKLKTREYLPKKTSTFSLRSLVKSVIGDSFENRISYNNFEESLQSLDKYLKSEDFINDLLDKREKYLQKLKSINEYVNKVYSLSRLFASFTKKVKLEGIENAIKKFDKNQQYTLRSYLPYNILSKYKSNEQAAFLLKQYWSNKDNIVKNLSINKLDTISKVDTFSDLILNRYKAHSQFNKYNTVLNFLKSTNFDASYLYQVISNEAIRKYKYFEKIGNIQFQKDELNRIIGQANIKAGTVLIDALNQRIDTLPHEYAHHYIAWFRNTPIVQEAIRKWGSEEALVQSIGEQAVKQRGEAWNWWTKFVKWIMDKFNSLSKLQKQELTQILTDAFLKRVDLETGEVGFSSERLRELQNRASGIFNQRENQIKTGVKELFNQYRELASIGTLEQYSAYLDTIFPDSKVKDIVYHYGYIPKNNNFIHFGSKKAALTRKLYAEEKGKSLYLSIINIKNPLFKRDSGDESPARFIKDIQNAGFETGINQDYDVPKGDDWFKVKNNYPNKSTFNGKEIPDINDKKIVENKLLNSKFDGFVYINTGEGTNDESFVVFRPEQVHILGSKQDIEGFREFVKNDNIVENNQYENINQQVEELFDKNLQLANEIYKTLGFDVIDESEITYTDEEGNPCAKDGMSFNKFTKGGKWEIVKEFKGASHERGGIDIEISNGTIKMTGKQGQIKAKNGLVINSKTLK